MSEPVSTPVNAYTIDKAREALTHYVIRKAAHTACVLGFSYEPADDAPNTFDALQAAFRASQRGAKPLPVWSGACDETIYTNAEGNYAFRFWHDVIHAVFGLDFSHVGETETAAKQLKDVEQHFGWDSIEARLFYWDPIGQIDYAAETGGQFVTDQRAFVVGRILSQV